MICDQCVIALCAFDDVTGRDALPLLSFANWINDWINTML